MSEHRINRKALGKFLIVVGILLIVIVGSCTSKAESDIPLIPVPSQSWEEYQSANPIITPEPTPEITPEPTKAPRPPMLGATTHYTRCQLKSYRRYLEPVIPPPATTMYQMLYSPYNTQSTVPSYAAVSGTSDGVQAGVPFTRFNSNDRAGSHPCLNASDSLINLYESYICFEWLFRYTSTMNITAGYGLDYGYETMFQISYDVNCYDHTTGDLRNDIPVVIVGQKWFDNGYCETYTYSHSLNDLRNGISITALSDQPDLHLFFVKFFVCIGMMQDYQQLDLTTRAQVPVFELQSGSNGMIIEALTVRQNISNLQLGDLIMLIPSQIGQLFMPTQESTEAWIQEQLQNVDTDSPTAIYYQAFIQLLSDIVNSAPDDFTIKVPQLKINIGGANYTYFNGYEYDFDDADIALTGQPNTLFYYTRLVGDVLIIGGFVTAYLYDLWKKIFDVTYAAGVSAAKEV